MKKNITYILFIILLIFVLFIGGKVPYFLFYVYISTLLVPLIHCFLIYKGLSGSVNIPNKSIYVGGKVAVTYTVRNLSKYTIPYLEIENSILKELTGEEGPKIMTTLNPKDFFTNNEVIVSKRRGYYPLGKIQLVIKDIFGFYSIKKNITSDTALLVYPIPMNINSFRITSIEQMGDMLIDNKAFQDKSRVASVRSFREGDSIKSIHWKLSAKLEDLIIKEFDNSADTNVVVFVDNYQGLYKGDLDRRLEDKVVDIAISIINYYIKHNIPVTLQTQDKNKIVEINGNEKSDLKPFLEVFARFEGNGAFELGAFIEKRMNINKRGSTVVIITPNIDKSIGTQGIMLKTRNLNPLFLVVTDKENKAGSVEPVVEKGLREEGIPIHLLDYRTNIQAALEGRNE